MYNLVFIFFSILIIILLYYIFKKQIKKHLKKLHSIFLITVVIWIIVAIIFNPKDSVDAALNGMKIWIEIVLPSLLPFFILSEILIGLGVVEFIGALLEPLMNPLFNVPGEGSFVLAMSVTSGYPVGAKLVCNLLNENSITKTEGQRMLCFCSTSGPLFMIGSVAVGMFNCPTIGSLIAISHYLGILAVGIVFRFYHSNDITTKKTQNQNYINLAFKKLFNPHKKDRKSFGVIIGNSVKESINTLLIIGGFIILYSVIIELLSITNIINFLSNLISVIFPFISNEELTEGLISGIIEMTNGCKIIASANSSNYIMKLCITSFLIGWSGFSIHSQVLSFVGKTNLNFNIYVLSKLMHGLFSSFITFGLFNIYYNKKIIICSSNIKFNNLLINSSWFSIFNFSLILSITIISTVILTSLLIAYIFSKKII